MGAGTEDHRSREEKKKRRSGRKKERERNDIEEMRPRRRDVTLQCSGGNRNQQYQAVLRSLSLSLSSTSLPLYITTTTTAITTTTMEKLPSHSSDLPPPSSQPLSRWKVISAALGRILSTVFLCFVGYLCITSFILPASPALFKGFKHSCSGSNTQQKVALEAHVMSKCPDARDCLQQLVLPVMEQTSDLIDFDLSFIAR